MTDSVSSPLAGGEPTAQDIHDAKLRLTERFGSHAALRFLADHGGPANAYELLNAVWFSTQTAPASIARREVTPDDLRDALMIAEEMNTQARLYEFGIFQAARAAGMSWQQIADARGFASRQAAEQRYKRLGGQPAAG